MRGRLPDYYCSDAAGAVGDSGRWRGELWGAAVDGGIEYRSKKDRKVERELRNHGQKFGREAGRSGDICP